MSETDLYFNEYIEMRLGDEFPFKINFIVEHGLMHFAFWHKGNQYGFKIDLPWESYDMTNNKFRDLEARVKAIITCIKDIQNNVEAEVHPDYTV